MHRDGRHRSRPRVTTLLALAALLLGAPLTAQGAPAASPDSLPFRRGQWGAQFAGAANFASAGVLRFSSPRRAWVVDGRFAAIANHSRASYFRQGPGGPQIQDSSDTHERSASITLQAGPRAYSPAGRAVHVYRGAGVIAGLSHDRFRSAGNPRTFTSWGWDAGAFAELGAAYRATPRLSLGAVAGVSGTYGEQRGDGGRFHDRRIRFDASAPSFTATIYF